MNGHCYLQLSKIFRPATSNHDWSVRLYRVSSTLLVNDYFFFS